jgi:4-amino-4-deoxy-L-arabinose transferase-like glycosyltransferase
MCPTCIIPRVGQRWIRPALLVLLLAALAAPRVVGISRFATIDEPYWLTAGSDFYYALGQREFAKTVYDYHPAVTTMWVIAAGMFLYFPRYRGFGQGYFDVYKDTLDNFLLQHGKSALGLLTASRLIQTAVIVALLLLVLVLLWRLIGGVAATGGVLLVAFDPFFLGHSRLLNHEGMLSLLTVTSLLFFLVFLLGSRKRILLILSGLAFGLAQLTKSSSVALLPVLALIYAVESWLARKSERRSARQILLEVALWCAMAVAIYVLLWPGMWVSPGVMLGEVFGNAFSYAFEGARLSAAAGSTAPDFQPKFIDIWLYFQSLLWRTTPVTWLGAILGVLALLWGHVRARLTIASVLLTGLLFVLLFGLASGRNSAHYILTTYVALDMVAGWGFSQAASWLSISGGRRFAAVIPSGLLTMAILGQVASVIPFFPYYYNYYSPLMEAAEPGRQNPNFGYGEGLDLAAAYLSAKPDAAQSSAMAFYGRGPFSWFYPGRTEPLKTVYADGENVPQLIQTLRRSTYLVIYYALEKGRDSPANLMHALRGVSADHAIWLNGIEYVRIYRVADLSPDFYAQLQP